MFNLILTTISGAGNYPFYSADEVTVSKLGRPRLGMEVMAPESPQLGLVSKLRDLQDVREHQRESESKNS